MLYRNKHHPTWVNYKVLSKRSWQKYAEPTSKGLEYKWVAESEDKAVLEGLKKLVEG